LKVRKLGRKERKRTEENRREQKRTEENRREQKRTEENRREQKRTEETDGAGVMRLTGSFEAPFGAQGKQGKLAGMAAEKHS
jgi:hypothetical protein